MIKITPKLKIMSIGTDCKFTKISNREKGPIDNIFCCNTICLESLLDKTYIKKFLQKNTHYINGLLFYDDLGYFIIHNEVNQKYIKEHLRRVCNFYNFLEKVKTDENYYFVLDLGRKDSPSIDVLKFKELLIKYNILNKTLVFGNSIYKNEFPNYYEIRDQTTSDEIDFLWSELSVLLYFQDFDIKDYDALLETLGVNI